MSNSIFSLKIDEIANLSEKYPIWKVHQLGELSINQTTYESQIDLWMVPLKNTKNLNLESERLVLSENYDFTESRAVKIGVGQLPIVGTGSFFENGTYLGYPSYITSVFDLDIGERNSGLLYRGGDNLSSVRKKSLKSVSFPVLGRINLLLVKLESRWQDYLTDETFIIKSERWKNKLRKIYDDVKSGKKKFYGLLIPCIEIVRFYYANSSQMFQQVFTDGLFDDDNRVFKDSRSEFPDVFGKNGFLYLSKWVKNIDAPIIARMAFDRVALDRAREIYASVVKAYNGRVPFVDFPFVNQKTKLKVHGTFVDMGGPVFFLVNWIESCTAVFPFQEFKFWRENPGRMARKPEGKDFEGNPVKFFYPEDYPVVNAKEYYFRRRSVELRLQSIVSPSKARGEIELLLPLNKFPDLQTKEWAPENPHPDLEEFQEDNHEKGFFDIDEPVGSVSTARQDGTKKVTKASLGTDFKKTEESQKKTGELPEANRQSLVTSRRFDKIVQIINGDKKLNFTAQRIYFLSNWEEFEVGDTPSKFPELDFDLIEDKKKTNYIKKLAKQDVYIMEIVYKGKQSSYFYLFDIVPFEYSGDRKQPKDSKNKKGKISSERIKRGFCLCLVFKEKSLQPLTTAEARSILKNCLIYGGTWFKSVVPVNVIDNVKEEINKKTKIISKVVRKNQDRYLDFMEMKIAHSFSSTLGYVRAIIRKSKKNINQN